MRAFVITGPGKADVRDVAPREPRPAGFVHASNATFMPALAADLVEPGRRLVYIGLAGEPSLVDTRTLVLKDVTAVGVRSASGGIAGTVELYASGASAWTTSPPSSSANAAPDGGRPENPRGPRR